MFTLLLPVMTAFIIVLMMTPSLIRIAREKNIFDEPGERKVHTARTPLLGGFSIFAGTLIAFLFWSVDSFQLTQLFVLVSLLILFATGFIDDLRPLSPPVKLFLQIAAAFITVVFAGNAIHGLHGLFGLRNLPEFISIPVTVLFILVIINAYNFIDGIDGLSTTIGFIASVSFGIFFLYMQDTFHAVMAFSLSGALLAFLIFNLNPAKIFMGDAGTLFTGFLLSLFAIRLTEGTRTFSEGWLQYESAPVFALAFLIIPVIDFIRVTSVRLLKGNSLIRADQNHIHHVLVQLGLTHLQTVALLALVQMVFIGAAFLLSQVSQSLVFSGMIVTGLLLSQVPNRLIKRRNKFQGA